MNKLIFKESSSGGNKSKNLFYLDNNLSKNKKCFIIPDSIVFNPGDNLNLLIEKIKLFRGKLAIRSDSIFEDGDNDSGAGVFETILNVDNNLDSIKKAIYLIQQDALSKVGEQISILIMEMVEEPDLAGTIFGIDSRTGNNNNYTVNYFEGLGSNVVDGNVNSHVQIINKNFNKFDNLDINKKFIGGLISATKQIENVFDSDLLDIEFAIKDGDVYILQVRPLTALDDFDNHIKDIFVCRILDIISSSINKEDLLLGDMIDINPAELLKDTRSKFINTLFADIFPKGPLKEARIELGYSVSDNEMFSIILNKFYINLEENIISFLPSTLLDDEKFFFISYYKNLIKKNSSLQDKLDTVMYPNNIEIVNDILSNINIEGEKRNNIINKFNVFFISLDDKFDGMYNNYINNEKEIIKNIFELESGKLEDINLNNIKNISELELLNRIKEITYLFTIYARGAFYYNNEDGSIEMNYFNSLKYSNVLIGVDKTFSIPNGFDILDNIEINFNGEQKKENINENYIPSKKEIFELARDNLKFLFMLLLAELGNKLREKINILGINKSEIYNLSMEELLRNIDNFDKLDFLINKRNTRNSKLENISVPSVISCLNLPGNHELMTSGTYIGKGEVNGACKYVSDSKELYRDNILNTLKNKILFLDTATPEIDGILPILLNNVSAIVTKYGGPGAHIVLRLREENKKRKNNGLNEIGLLVGLGDSFDSLKNKEKIILNFNNSIIG